MSEAERDAQAQAHADRLFAGLAAPRWRVSLGGWPTVVLPAESEAVAAGRYDNLMGITSAGGLKHAVELVEDYPAPLPAEVPGA